MDILEGSLVYSKAGRDKGKLFMVVKTEADFVYLADGDTRRINNPKKKKPKHIISADYMPELDIDAISDSNIRKVLSEYSAR
ncbi:MAG: KOW domain-containing RNA-binding protein [Firmicutes bacterium]|nr:KOW domain-containing RNA-binding protein [Bacillota bacterium]